MINIIHKETNQMSEKIIPRYENYNHYINEGWSKEPKFTFQKVYEKAKTTIKKDACVLDIGCATGEFIAYMASQQPSWNFVGIDVFDELIDKAREFVPDNSFINCDYLKLKQSYNNSFDLITAVGVISLFSGDDIDKFWKKSFELLKPGGRIIVLGPLNEFGIDMDLKHRKWVNGTRKGWERGWSIPSLQSVELAIKKDFNNYSITPYEPKLDLEPRQDPIRTWTVSYKDKERQLTNGLKLLVDYYLIEAIKD